MNISGIYKITNMLNNHCYIGSTMNIKNRWTVHKRFLNSNKHHSQYFQNAWNKYGKDKFKFEILLYCDKKDLIFFEQRAINTYRPEYNICLTAGNSLGRKFSDTSKQKMSIKRKARITTKETCKKISEAQKRIGNRPPSGKGKVRTENFKKNLSNKRKGNYNPSAKLNWNDVTNIRLYNKINSMSKKDIAVLFNVSLSCIYNIISNKTWKI